MPLPFIIGLGAAIAGATGVGSGIHGAAKMKEAKDTMESAEYHDKKNRAHFEEQSEITTLDMDNLGKRELGILKSFERFSETIDKIQNKPEFKAYHKEGVSIPGYNAEELKEVSIGAGVLLGGIGGAALGTAGGFAAAGATTVAVMALGTASTGTAIATLSGAAATNATIAAIGGGAIAAGGGGIALGTTLLGAATLGVGFLVGGVIFNKTGSSLSDKADEAWSQMRKAEKEINKICTYLQELSSTAIKFDKALSTVDDVYLLHLNKLIDIVEVQNKRDWNIFTREEKLITKNTTLLVNLLFNMGKVQLVLDSEDEAETKQVNIAAVNKSIEDAEKFLDERGLGAEF